jgi:hypothetical protein
MEAIALQMIKLALNSAAFSIISHPRLMGYWTRELELMTTSMDTLLGTKISNQELSMS